MRILEQELGYAFSSEQIISSQRKANVDELNSTTFKTLYYERVFQRLKKEMGIDFGRNVYTRAAIRTMLAIIKEQS